MPVSRLWFGVLPVFPAFDRRWHGRFVGKGAVESLAAEDGEFDFGHVEPRTVDGGVDDFHSLQVRLGHVGGKWS